MKSYFFFGNHGNDTAAADKGGRSRRKSTVVFDLRIFFVSPGDGADWTLSGTGTRASWKMPSMTVASRSLLIARHVGVAETARLVPFFAQTLPTLSFQGRGLVLVGPASAEDQVRQ